MSLKDQAPDQGTKSQLSVRDLARMAIFIGLSAVGSFVKLGPTGSIALDSAPGFFAAIAFGPGVGFTVIAIGHLLSAVLVGFPLTLPIHVVIAAGMGFCALAFRALGRRGPVWLVAAVVVTTLLNSVVLGLIAIPTGGGWPAYAVLVPILAAAALVNLVIAAIAWWTLRNSKLLN